MKKKYLTITEASKLLTLAESTLYGYVHHRYIPFIKIGGRILFDESILHKWIKSKEKEVIKR